MCQGVRVPPQSKMTASTGGRDVCGHRATQPRTTDTISAAADATGTSTRSPVRRSLISTSPSAEPLSDHDDRRHPEQLGVLELHPGRHLGPVVVEHPDAGRLQLAAKPSAAANTASSLPVATMCTSAGAISRGQHRPDSS